jgi:hypothetical protein
MVWFGESSGLISPQTAAASHSLPYLRQLPAQAQNIFGGLKPMISDFWRESGSMMDRMERQSVQRTETQPSIYNIPDDPNGASPNPNPKPEEKPAGSSWFSPTTKPVEKKEISSEIFDINEDEKPKRR